MKIRNVLISQPKPESEKSPYYDIARNYKVNFEFRPFIKVEGMPCNDFRKQRIDLSQYSCIILNSRNAVDNYFRIASEMRYTVPEKNKYFCLSEAVALYLQKYIVYRKRKIFFSQQSIEELSDLIRKNKDEKFLFPCSDKHLDKITEFLQANRINFTKGVFYCTVSSNMTDLAIKSYDMIVFFTPHGVQSLFDNFPDYAQGEQKIGVFGYAAYQMALSLNLHVDLIAPMPHAPSMTMALEWFIRETNKAGVSPAPIIPPAPEPPKVIIPVQRKAKGKKQKSEITEKVTKPVKEKKQKPVKEAKQIQSKSKTASPKKSISRKSAKPVSKKIAKKSTAKAASSIAVAKKTDKKKQGLVKAKSVVKSVKPKFKKVAAKKKAATTKKPVIAAKKVVKPTKKTTLSKKLKSAKPIVVKKKITKKPSKGSLAKAKKKVTVQKKKAVTTKAKASITRKAVATKKTKTPIKKTVVQKKKTSSVKSSRKKK
ncbi:MAG: uroporphyrinogen-III synthase [Flavobacteriales bacterium]|nr:uroporphyrinogen-III synthase [Flavobacteriales bacterium]